MKDLVETVIGWIIAFFIIAGWIKYQSNQIEIGQTWYKNETANPYIKKILFRKVIDMNGKYLEYIENESDTFSCRKERFYLANDKLE